MTWRWLYRHARVWAGNAFVIGVFGALWSALHVQVMWQRIRGPAVPRSGAAALALHGPQAALTHAIEEHADTWEDDGGRVPR